MEITPAIRIRALSLRAGQVRAGYIAAVERIETIDDHPCGPPDSDLDIAAYPDDRLVWVEAIGSHVHPDTAREHAYELLVLADLAEAGDTK